MDRRERQVDRYTDKRTDRGDEGRDKCRLIHRDRKKDVQKQTDREKTAIWKVRLTYRRADGQRVGQPGWLTDETDRLPN